MPQSNDEQLKQKIQEIEFLNQQLKQVNAILEENAKLFVHGPVTVFKWINELDTWPAEYVSPNVLDNLGYLPQDFRIDPDLYKSSIHPEDVVRAQNEMKAHSASGKDYFTHTPYRLRKKDGEYILIYDYTVILRNDQGNIEGYIGYIINLSEVGIRSG